MDGVECAQSVLAKTAGGLQRRLVHRDEREAGEDYADAAEGRGGSTPRGGKMNLDEHEGTGHAKGSPAERFAQRCAFAFLDDELDDG